MNYRNKKLLDLPRDPDAVPFCLWCGAANYGQIVAAHSEQLRDGFGKGIKAHDYRIAYLCDECHRNQDKEMWEAAHRATIGFLFQSGFLKVET
jgi:hypothetical protein